MGLAKREHFRIRVAQPSDADALGIIGPAIYAESYGHVWDDPRAYAAHLESFGTSAIASFMARQDTGMWLAEYDGAAVGFLSLVLTSPDPVEGRRDGAEVPRIYLLGPARGKGLGAALLVEAERHATERGANHLWLDAMKAAPWAWQTYLKWGFDEIGETVFPGAMKPECRPMIVMRRPCLAR